MMRDDLMNRLFDIDFKNDDQARAQLRTCIKPVFDLLNQEKMVTDWQKVKYACALAAYEKDMLELCRWSLVDVFIEPKEITRDERYLKPLKKSAEGIDLLELISEVRLQ